MGASELPVEPRPAGWLVRREGRKARMVRPLPALFGVALRSASRRRPQWTGGALVCGAHPVARSLGAREPIAGRPTGFTDPFSTLPRSQTARKAWSTPGLICDVPRGYRCMSASSVVPGWRPLLGGARPESWPGIALHSVVQGLPRSGEDPRPPPLPGPNTPEWGRSGAGAERRTSRRPQPA